MSDPFLVNDLYPRWCFPDRKLYVAMQDVTRRMWIEDRVRSAVTEDLVRHAVAEIERAGRRRVDLGEFGSVAFKYVDQENGTAIPFPVPMESNNWDYVTIKYTVWTENGVATQM